MKTRMMVENPNEIELTIKITMTAKEWDDLRSQLESKWPSSRLSQSITDALGQIRKVVYAKEIDNA